MYEILGKVPNKIKETMLDDEEERKQFNAEMKALVLEAKEKYMSKLAHLKNIEEITWKYIPPYSPWLGGIWKATVKSIKRYLMPLISVEFTTPLQIQSAMNQCAALLNSRPLCTYIDNGQEKLLKSINVKPSSERKTNRVLEFIHK